jgi:hypothetical protein
MNIRDSLTGGFALHAKICAKITSIIDDEEYASDLPSLIEAAEVMAKSNIALLEQTRKYYEVFRDDKLIGVNEVVDAVAEVVTIDKDSYKNSKMQMIIGGKDKAKEVL